MNRKKITQNMITQMSRQSLKSSPMKNLFVMITIILASSLLTTILLYATGQKEQTREELSHRQQASYYNLTRAQAEALGADPRIASHIQVKTGVLSQMEGYDVMPCYTSALLDEIRVGELESGTLPRTEGEIALQAALLEKMNLTPALGTSVTFTFYDGSEETFTVSGLLKGGQDTRQFKVFLSETYAQNGSQLQDVPYEVYARLRDTSGRSAEELRTEIYAIGSGAGLARKNVNPSKAFLDFLSPSPQMLLLCVLAGGVILLACVLVIYGVFYLSVIGRIHQFGQLSTIGMTRKQIKKLVSREGGILSLRAAPAGIALGGIAGYLILPEGFRFGNLIWTGVLVYAAVCLITQLSVRRPAKLAAKISPMEALRYVPQETMSGAAGRKMCRGLSPLKLGVMNFSKNRKKAAVTMLSLALGGILFMTAATYMSSYDKRLYARQGDFRDAEFVISFAPSAVELSEFGLSGIQAKNPMNEKMVSSLNALEGVLKVTEVKNFGVKFDAPWRDEYGANEETTLLTREETEDLERYLEEGSADYEKLSSGNYVLATDSKTMEEIYGWHFQTGDKVTFNYYDGEKMTQKEMTVLGILNQQFIYDRNGLDGWFVMPLEAAKSLVSYPSLNTKLLVSTDPERESAVGEALEQILEKEPALTLETLAERRIRYQAQADQLFGAISGLAAFIMMFSILSMINTLTTNIYTRKQELAMLESIGMSRRQIRRMLLGESLLLVLAAVGATMTLGTLCGRALSGLLYKNGAFYMAFRFPAALGGAYALVLASVPFLITLASMHSFSRESLVVRLRGAES